jgi:aryl-alcohol dehydrogenase-like predicted oxidoreductase
MDRRRLGRTEHMSTVAILGAAAFGHSSQDETDTAMETVLHVGVNHIDVAPTYGAAEERLGPWLARERRRFFLGCKTAQRTRDGARQELERSLLRLQVDALDLYQLHAVATLPLLDQVTAPGGALEAMLAAREEGLTRFIGITTHGWQAPAVLLEALRRFDFDTVLFPLNFIIYGRPTYRADVDELLRQCRARDVGMMTIKAIAKGPWANQPHRYRTWYEPFDQPQQVQQAVDFVLSHDVTGLCTAGDVALQRLVLRACERFQPMPMVAQKALLATAAAYEPIIEPPA